MQNQQVETEQQQQLKFIQFSNKCVQDYIQAFTYTFNKQKSDLLKNFFAQEALIYFNVQQIGVEICQQITDVQIERFVNTDMKFRKGLVQQQSHQMQKIIYQGKCNKNGVQKKFTMIVDVSMIFQYTMYNYQMQIQKLWLVVE
ncbi:Hypothetical_protein [Hexamita inflata]|uniref:Hypothetical_protein n=1 Tax=Hexamita inflata TaxID=28002 RepID=A0AA86NX75_9EUKA|nr:Hypothetical protein HINF_LOCUS14961 [Hexamita inflata]